MPYTIQQLDDMPAPTVLAQMLEPFDQNSDTLSSLSEADRLLAGIEGDTVYLIIDLSLLVVDMGGLMQGFATAFLPNNGVATDHVFASRVRTLMIGSGSRSKPLRRTSMATARSSWLRRWTRRWRTSGQRTRELKLYWYLQQKRTRQCRTPLNNSTIPHR